MDILKTLASFISPPTAAPQGGFSTRTWLIIVLMAGFSGYYVGRHQAPPAPASGQGQPVGVGITHQATTTVTYAPKPAPAAPDIQANLGKAAIRVSVNGQEQVFNKSDQEAYALDKNAIKIDQVSKVDFAITVPPVDNTRHYSLGFMAGLYGGGLTFRHDRLGLDIYKEWGAQEYGATVRYEVLQW